MEVGAATDAIRQLRDDEFGRVWTKEVTVEIIEAVLHLKVLLDLSMDAACELVARLWRRRKEKVLEVVNGWMEQRKVLWSPPRPPGAASPSYPHLCASLDSTHHAE
jgi:hypothetical protein